MHREMCPGCSAIEEPDGGRAVKAELAIDGEEFE